MGNEPGLRPLERKGAAPAEDRWIIFFSDPDRKPIHFSGEGAERAAHRTFKRMLGAWSCRLFKTIELSMAEIDDYNGSYEIGSGGEVPSSENPLLQAPEGCGSSPSRRDI